MYNELSLRPFLLLAFCEWCEHFGVTPFLLVQVDDHVTVPRAFVRENVIVLNISQEATQKLEIKGDGVRFYARFAGIAHHVEIPIGNVIGCFSSEPQQGLQFEFVPLQKSGKTEVKEDSDNVPDLQVKSDHEVQFEQESKAETEQNRSSSEISSESGDKSSPSSSPSSSKRPQLRVVKK